MLIIALLYATALQAGSAGNLAGAEPSLQCDTGPVRRSYGGHSWLVYSCADRVSLAIVAERDNPAFEFYFIFHPVNGLYVLYGEGIGARAVSSAAAEELGGLNSDQIDELIRATQTRATKGS